MKLAMRSAESIYGIPDFRSDREQEYDAFCKVTRMLQEASREKNVYKIIRAVNLNSDLWTVLADDLSTPENKLPDNVKAGLISLAAFSIKAGQMILVYGQDPIVLVDINISVMKGLRVSALPAEAAI